MPGCALVSRRWRPRRCCDAPRAFSIKLKCPELRRLCLVRARRGNSGDDTRPGDVGCSPQTSLRRLGRNYSLARARDPVAPRPLTAAAGPWRHPVLAWHSNRCVPCVSAVRPLGVYLLGRPGWREPLCLTPSTLKHSRTLLHLLAQRLPLSEWPRCSTESAAHDSTTARYYMFFNTGPTSLRPF